MFNYSRVTSFCLSFMGLFSLLLLSFMLNVLVHEMGHYAVAASFNLDPEAEFFNPMTAGPTGFTVGALASVPLASVQFRATSDTWAVLSVTLAGVLFNALLGLLITFVYAQITPNPNRQILYLALVIPCVLSILLNLNVFSSISDGAQVWNIFFGS